VIVADDPVGAGAPMSAADLATLAAAQRWSPNTGACRLTNDERDAVHARIDALAAARIARAEAHGERIASMARRLGRMYASGHINEHDAARRLAPLISATDIDPATLVPMPMITAKEGDRIAITGFALGATEEGARQ
jgi:hypothetical protein